jgi:hypothetical protein
MVNMRGAILELLGDIGCIIKIKEISSFIWNLSTNLSQKKIENTKLSQLSVFTIN